jgi:zinc transport system ATP-binding protein
MNKSKAKTTSASNETTSGASELPLHASKPLVDVDSLTVVLGGQPVVSDVSFCIHRSEFIGLIGPNGAGKTTLLRAVLGLQKYQQGNARVTTRRVGYIPQRTAIHQSQVPMSVLEVVQLGSRVRAMESLARVDMATFAQRPFMQLSGGQQQRVLIAKALAGDPELLILDEPTTGIDEQSQREFYKTLQELQTQGIAIIMVSHDVDAVLQLVTRVMCVNGSILYDGPPEHFETDKYLPKLYTAQHRLLHHKHGVTHA